MHSLVLRRQNTAAWVRALSVVLFAVATGLGARISVLLPFSPVPLTLQVLVVIVSGFVLGPRDSFVAQLLYLQAILLGAPLTATGLAGPLALVAPTAGYLWSFPIAAATAGWLSTRTVSIKPLWRALGGLGALVVVYSFGMGWLSHFVGGMGYAWELGVMPFVGADVLKVILAAALFSTRDRA